MTKLAKIAKNDVFSPQHLGKPQCKGEFFWVFVAKLKAPSWLPHFSSPLERAAGRLLVGCHKGGTRWGVYGGEGFKLCVPTTPSSPPPPQRAQAKHIFPASRMADALWRSLRDPLPLPLDPATRGAAGPPASRLPPRRHCGARPCPHRRPPRTASVPRLPLGRPGLVRAVRGHQGPCLSCSDLPPPRPTSLRNRNHRPHLITGVVVGTARPVVVVVETKWTLLCGAAS